MLDVASLAQFDFFQHFRPYAGTSGNYRIISNVVILDHEVLLNDYSDFHEGDFVITNLLYGKDHPELIQSSFMTLMEKGVSAIAIKSIFYDTLPGEIMTMADQYQVPVFFFNHIYIEDVLLTIMDDLRNSSNASYYEKLVDRMRRVDHDEAIQLFLEESKIPSSASLFTIYLSYKAPMDEITLQRNFNQILHQKNRQPNGEHTLLIKYKKGFLLLIYSNDEAQLKKYLTDWKFHLADLGLSPKDYHVGIMDTLLNARQLDLGILRCLYANELAIVQNQETFYSGMGLNHLFLGARDAAYTHAYLSELETAIRNQESKDTTHLMDTLRSSVKHHFHMEKISQELFTHPNTIRYRLGKIKAILNCQDDLEFQILATMMMGIGNSKP